jgi:hypothetical protein
MLYYCKQETHACGSTKVHAQTLGRSTIVCPLPLSLLTRHQAGGYVVRFGMPLGKGWATEGIVYSMIAKPSFGSLF